MDKISHKDVPHDDFRPDLLRMVTEGWIGRVTDGIQAAIAASFQTDIVLRPSRSRTKNEVRRRFNICVRGFNIMRRDLGWAVPRIIDEMPVYLRCKLDGAPWAPDEVHDSWVAKETVQMVVDGGDIAPDVDEVHGAQEVGPDAPDPDDC